MTLSSIDFSKINKLLKEELSENNKVLRQELAENRKAIVEGIFRYLDENFVTKENFQELKELISHLPNKEQYYNRMDKVMSELKKIREEQPVLSRQVSEHSDRLEKLEKIHPRGRHLTL